jgi:hypothetical protein
MSNGMLALMSAIGYLAGGLIAARYTYGKMRPSRYPLCGKREDEWHGRDDGPCRACGHPRRQHEREARYCDTVGCYCSSYKPVQLPGHHAECYRRNKDAATSGGAVGWALSSILVWLPALLIFTIGTGVGWLITGGHKLDEAEVAAKIRLLEIENKIGEPE